MDASWRKKEQFPFKEAINIITEDGVPVHGLKYNIGGVEITEEAFCDTVRKSSCYIKYSLKNTTAKEVNQKFSLIIRTGKEVRLICGDGCDQYGDYNPIEDNRIQEHPATWKLENEVYTDGERVLTQIGGELPVWDEKEGSLDFDFVLAPNEEKEITFIFNKGEDVEKNYNSAKEKTEAFWRNELKRLNKLPLSWQNDPETLKMIRHFTVQMLQCFMYSVGKEYLLFRHGGMQHTPMGGLMWYTSAPEYRWFVGWKRYGDSEKMQEILDYQLKYFVSPEYTMQERYIENLEYFTPWCPNASAMARTILMMLGLEN